MKRFLLAVVLLLPLVSLRAGEPFFCMQPGRTLYYERNKAGNGHLERSTSFDIVSVKPSADGGRLVEYGFTLRKPNGADMYGGRAAMSVKIDANGGVYMDLGASMMTVLGNVLGTSDLHSNGATSLLPADIKPGDRLPEAHCSVEAAGFRYSIDVTEREVLRTERITTPAGTFDCVVVREHKVEKGFLRNRNTWSDSWYVAGIGYVRHDTYDKNMRLDTTEVLKNY